MNNNKPNLHLIFPDTHSPHLLGVADASYYPTTPINPTIEITPPNTRKMVMPFAVGGMTTYNSNDLGITCEADFCSLVTLPDGIWEVKYSIAPSHEHNNTFKFIRVYNLNRRFEVAFLKTDLKECDTNVKEQDKEILDQINYFIQGAIATANDCNYTRAMELYHEADINFSKTACSTSKRLSPLQIPSNGASSPVY